MKWLMREKKGKVDEQNVNDKNKWEKEHRKIVEKEERVNMKIDGKYERGEDEWEMLVTTNIEYK